MKVKTGEPMPAPVGAGSARKDRKFGKSPLYGFGRMAIGDSMTGPHKIATAARKYGREHGWRFTTRKTSATKTTVWHIE